jgi:O-antigen ligase
MVISSIRGLGFAFPSGEPANVHYQTVADHIVRANPLDPLAAIVFVAVFVGATLLTLRRPAFGLCALIAAVPFALYRDVLGTTVTIPKVVVLGVALGLTAYAGRLPSLRAVPVRTFLIAAGCLIAASALSILQAGSHGAAARETLKLVEYALAFLTAYLCFKLDPADEPVRLAIAAVVSIVALGALAQEFGDAPSVVHFNNSVVPRIAGTLEGPNQLAGYLEIGIALLAAFVCARPRWEFSVALGLAAFADILTYSRFGLTGAAIAIAIVAIVYRRAALGLVAPLVAAALAGAGTTVGWAESAHVGAGTIYAGGVGPRSDLWRAAVTLWREHPIFGVGAGNFELDLPGVGLSGVRTHANSLYLQALVEGGIPLILATLYFVWTSIASFVRRASASPFVCAALAASIALALHQTVDDVVFYPKVGEMWWIVLAIGAACA